MTAPIDTDACFGPNSGSTVNSAKRFLLNQFREAGLDTPDLDARALLIAVTGFTHSDLITRGTEGLPPNALELISDYASRRLGGEPVDHILGYREFYGRRFKVSKDVLSPRPETEMLIDAALLLLKDNPAPRILDLGTGSGAISLTLLAELEKAIGVAVDVSPAALSIAKDNAVRLGVASRMEWIEGSWFEGVKGSFDLILSNPPYITDAAMAQLAPEVSGFDPALALSGGADGLAPYRAIISNMGGYMKANGEALFEIGYDQREDVLGILVNNGFINGICTKDLSGHDRMIKVQKPL